MTVDSPTETATGFDTSDNLDTFSKDFFNPRAVKEEKPAEAEPEAEEPEVEEVAEPDEADAPDGEADADEPDTDGEAEEPEEESPEDKKAKRKSAQDRIKELTAQRYEAERQAAVRIAELEGRLAELSKTEKPNDTPPAEAQGAPDPQAVDKDGNLIYTLGEFDPKYIQDLTRFTIQQEREAAKAYEDQEKQKAAVDNARAEARTQWVEKLNSSMEEIPDIEDKIKSLDTVVASVPQDYGQYLVDVIMTLENGPRVLAYLSDNKAEAQKIVTSGPAAATVALGRIDARVAKVSAAPKTPTTAPKPPTKTPRGTSGQFSTRADTDDLDAFTKEFFGKK